MKRETYTDQERESLLTNPNVLKIGNSNITYCPEFKLKAIKEYTDGKFPMQIFIDAGIDVSILGAENPGRCLARWKKSYKKQGEKGLLDEQRGKLGRPRTKELTIEEKVKYLESRNAYLEAENEFLKKLKALERGWK
jgi:transposase